MLKHIVMYKLKNPTKEDCQALSDLFLSMRGKIPCLIDINSGVDIVKSERSYDVALVSTFENVDKLNEYKTHKVHLPVVEYVKSVVEVSHSVDFEF